jgi:hypothetical protein
MLSKKIASIGLLLSFSLNVWAGPTVEEFLKEQREETEYKISEYDMSPLARYMSREQYAEFKKTNFKGEERPTTEMLEGRVITINTKDKEGCLEAKKLFNLGSEVCAYDAENPLVSVVVMKHDDNRESFEKRIDFSKMSEKQKIALTSLLDFGVMGVGTMGLIYALPESVSKWDKSRGFSALAGQYKDRIKAGPVVDEDDWAINYIGHPLSGAFYYTMVRHQGFSALESAAFSFCMSTFFWEYGLEAFAEVPSIQDLILTPLIGSIIGEVFYSWGNAIERNNGKLLGSKGLGKTATVLMNPAGALAKKINNIAKYKLIKDAELSFVTKNPMDNSHVFSNELNDKDKKYMGLQLKFKF